MSADDPTPGCGPRLLGEEVRVRGDRQSADRTRAGRLVVRAPQRPLSRCSTTPPWSCLRRRFRRGGGLDWLVGMQLLKWARGVFDSQRGAPWLLQAPDLRLRQGHRRAECRRHRARSRGARARDGIRSLRGVAPAGPSTDAWGVNHVDEQGGGRPRARSLWLSSGHGHPARALVARLRPATECAFGEDIASYSEPAARGRGAAMVPKRPGVLLAYISGV